jgi:class 3 adenylate cyclase
LDDVDLLRVLAAVKIRLNTHAAALVAAAQEARRRNLLPKEKDGPKGPPSLVVGTKTGATVTESGTDGKQI